MEGYAKLYNDIKTYLQQSEFVNVVTEGLGDEIDLSKQTIFPLSHLVINNADFQNNAVQFQFDLYCMDIVDISDSGVDNKHDVLNTQYNVLLRMYEDLRRGNLWTDNQVEVVTMNIESFEQAYENYLAGWKANIVLLIPNHMTIC